MHKQEFPPGPNSARWRGNYKEFRRDPLSFLTGVAQQYGDVVGMRYYKYRVYILNHPDDIETVGLLTSEGDFWLRQRRLAQPAFHRARIAGYAETMVRFAERLIDGWRPGETLDVHHEMMQLTLAIVAKTLFDADVTGDAKEIGEALEVVVRINLDPRRLLFVPPWLPTPANLAMKRAVRRLDRVIYRIIAERRANGRDTLADRGDLLSLLLHAQDDDGSRMTDVQLRDESVTLFLAGHETTAIALSWTWWLLAQHPEAEAKLHLELAEVLGGRAPVFDDLPRLRYTEIILTESLRLYPPAWSTVRMATENCEIRGYTIPAGAGVAMSQYVVHRDPRFFEAPDEFRPERWADGLAKRLPKFAYFPFGGGPRVCIGNSFALMEATLILATIAQKYRPRLVPNQIVEPQPSITLRPKHGIRVLLEKR